MPKYIDVEMFVSELEKRADNAYADSGIADTDVYTEGLIEGLNEAKNYARHTAPAADVAPVVHGYWHSKYESGEFLDCSNCSYGIFHTQKTPYCPNCGAKMLSND